MLTTTTSSASHPHTANHSTAPDPAFLAALLDARLHAITVLRSILNLATLSPEARAAILSDKTGQLTLLRESRLAAAQILNLPLPEALPKGAGQGMGSSPPHTPRATGSPRDHKTPPQPTHPTDPPAPHLDATPRQPVRTAHNSSPAIPHTTVDHPAPTPLIRRDPPTKTMRLLARAGAAP